MTRLEVVRYTVLLVPCLALWAVVWRGPRTRREFGALLLSGLAAFAGLGVLHEAAAAAGWWSYLEVAGSWRGLPVDLWLGWTVLWGPLPVALRRHVGAVMAVGAAAWLDVVAMPVLTPLVVLGDAWLWGEALGLVGVLLPAMVLGRWTAESRSLMARSALQAVVFAGLVFWLLPTTAFAMGDGGWEHLVGRTYLELAMVAQLAALIAVPALAAAQELAERGGGTPFPWDPPARLVTSGPYAYVSNPMQISATTLLLLLAALTHSWSLAAAAIAAVAFSVTVAAPHEREHLRARFGGSFDRYRGEVPTWRPRWRPFVADRATLFVARDCATCRQLGIAVFAGEPERLVRADADTHERVLQRVRYGSEDGHAEDGLPAIARAMEHLHLGVAPIGWVVRLPGLRRVFQLIADTVGPPPRPAEEVAP